MADVKWIKLATGLPDNKKIKQIRKLPGGDTIALMWVFLMCLAGETNEDGMVYFTPEIPYTEEMLADQFSMDINTVKLGLNTFERFGMIEVVDDIICLATWEKWQAVDSLSSIREKTRKRVAKHREKQKLLASNVTCNVTVTPCNAIDKDIDIDKIENKEEDKNISKKPPKRKHGEFQNVLLSEKELAKLQDDFGYLLIDKAIKFLDEYIEEKGYKSKSHNLAIRRWVIDAVKQQGEKQQKPQSKSTNTGGNVFLEIAKDENLF